MTAMVKGQYLFRHRTNIQTHAQCAVGLSLTNETTHSGGCIILPIDISLLMAQLQLYSKKEAQKLFANHITVKDFQFPGA